MLDELTIEAYEESFVVVLQYGGNDVTWKWAIDDLHWIPRESNVKDVAAMLDELTIEDNEESFVIVLQHGGNGITLWKRSITQLSGSLVKSRLLKVALNFWCKQP